MIKPIQYLRHEHIDKAKWDNTVENSLNGFVYCRSFFLDTLCSWDALVLGDYEYIMPLPNKKKWGICYIYTPFFVGQAGVISPLEISSDIISIFLKAIPKHFFYIDFHLNEGNSLNEINQKDIVVIDRVNYILLLNKPYHLLESNYSKDAKKNLRQAAQYQLSVVEGIDIKLVVNLFREAYGALNNNINDIIYAEFTVACTEAIQQKLGFTFGLKDSNGQIVSAAFLGKDDKRIYYICGAPSQAGRKMNAQHVLIDELLKKYAGSGLVFDFEGSDITAVGNFYKKFSPELRMYQQIKINRLPFLVKWLKS